MQKLKTFKYFENVVVDNSDDIEQILNIAKDAGLDVNQSGTIHSYFAEITRPTNGEHNAPPLPNAISSDEMTKVCQEIIA